MNPILQVKLNFSDENNTASPKGRNLSSKAETTVEKIDVIIDSLNAVLRYYRNSPRYVSGCLIDANYNDIIAKSKRIKELIKPLRQSTNDVVVGARFSDAPEGFENHIITYYVDEATILRTITELQSAKAFLTDRLGGKATAENFASNNKAIRYEGYGFGKTKMRDLIIDCSVIDSFSVPHISSSSNQDSFLITFYKTELSVSDILEKLKIDEMLYRYSFYGTDTISANKELLDVLEDEIPYMISMISSDWSKIAITEIVPEDTLPEVYIPSPSNEPVIGVIDTFFDEKVYFHEWVDNVDYLDDLERMTNDLNHREHGTEVTSIIVDGPRLNPWLDDGCGMFRVRHFGVCSERINTARLVRKIKSIVDENPDIHVWNLSLGAEDEVSKNFISYDAAVLDELQAKRNIVFVVSGTNDNRELRTGRIKVGSPADSLNSIVVNSVRRNGTPASYSRTGSILSFFNKPDVSYYGGDYDERIVAYSPTVGNEEVYGTSFAAPWISRKMCYLIDVMGLPREVAKAMIIDSAAGWEYKTATYKSKDIVGYGAVPIDISRILSTDSEEIKFVVYGTSASYRTTNYAIPVPRDEDNKYPYVARATLCYFPECAREQGVDYTSRELSLKFGRIKSDGSIDDINENVQDDDGTPTTERQSRKEFRKWENTKFISKALKNNKPIKSYDERLWGIAITSKERLATKTKEHLNFGAIITLREINGVNRIQDFVRACTLRGWIVNELNVENRIEVYNTTQEDVVFDLD